MPFDGNLWTEVSACRHVRTIEHNAKIEAQGTDEAALPSYPMGGNRMSSLVGGPGRLGQHVARQVRKSPGFFLAAVITLALGIGANAAMFSVVYAVLLKPLPYQEPERLVSVRNTAPGIGWPRCPLAPATYFTYREENRVFEDVAAWSTRAISVTNADEPERVTALLVTDGLLPLLRIRPLVGRQFTREDAVGPGVVMLTYAFWQQRFAGDRGVLGRKLLVDGVPREIIAILPRDQLFREPFSSTLPVMALLPLPFDRARTTIMNFGYAGLARLKPGVTIDEANRDVRRMIPLTTVKFRASTGLGPTFLADMKMGPDVHPLAEDVTGNIGRILWILMGTIGMVFLIACANVANLFLVRAETRQQELAVRAALGASRGRLARALLSESVALGIAGGVAGIGFAEVCIRVVRTTAPAALPRVNEIALGPLVLVFAALLSVVAGFLFGLIPVVKFASPRLAALKDGGRSGTEGRDRHRTRSALVVSEIALALVLLVASGLMIRTFQALGKVDPGFVRGEQILTFALPIPRPLALDAERTLRRQYEIVNRIQQVPGVQSVGLTSVVPLTGSNMENPFLVEDHPEHGNTPMARRMTWILPGYFETMGTRLVAGRHLTWNDVFSYTPVVLVNERLARLYWKTPEEAVGKRVREGARSPWRQIIGVVADIRNDGVAQDAPPHSYWPAVVKDFFDTPIVWQSGLNCVIRSPRTGTPAFLNELREAVRSIDKTVPLARVRTVEAIAATSMAQRTFAVVMLAIAAGVALLLGAVGIYGVIAYITAQRTREVGIRMALGARPGDIAQLFLRHGAALACIGIALGVVAAMALSRLMTSLLFGVSARDPITYVAVSAALATVVLLAGYLPSRRAARMQPVAALRSDV